MVKFKTQKKEKRIMVMLQRKLKCKYVGTDEFMPKDITREKMMPVIGFEVQRREAEYDGKKRIEDDLFLLVVNNNGRIVRVAAWCCKVIIDEDEKAIAGIAQSVGSVASMIMESSNEGMIQIKQFV